MPKVYTTQTSLLLDVKADPLVATFMPAIASPAYLARHGMPKVPHDLTRHNCIGIRQGEEAYGVWRLSSGRGKAVTTEAVKTRGNLATNDGEIAVNWALDGHGILMRAEWDIERHIKSGRLVQVLPQCFTPDADVYAVYPQRHQMAARVRAFVDFVATAFSQGQSPQIAEMG